jgi:hypothetical protein
LIIKEDCDILGISTNTAMSNEIAKFINSQRRLREQSAIAKQRKIAKAHGFPTGPEHRLAKIHATTCGDSNCAMCGNPRKFFGEKTIQEQRLFQDTEKTSDRHSNGITPKDLE